MNRALFKHDSTTARQAMLRLDSKGESFGQDAPLAAVPTPSPHEQEVARLAAEVEALTDELAGMKAGWAEDLAAARAEAKAEAAREHVRDDARRLEALAASLAKAEQQFQDLLASEVEPLAARLAARAVGQLVALRQGEEDWLGQVIARRLEGIAAGSFVSLHVAPSDAGAALSAALSESGVPAAQIKADPAVRQGTARLLLALGEIEVCPEHGAKEILRLLEQAGGELG